MRPNLTLSLALDCAATNFNAAGNALRICFPTGWDPVPQATASRLITPPQLCDQTGGWLGYAVGGLSLNHQVTTGKPTRCWAKRDPQTSYRNREPQHRPDTQSRQ